MYKIKHIKTGMYVSKSSHLDMWYLDVDPGYTKTAYIFDCNIGKEYSKEELKDENLSHDIKNVMTGFGAVVVDAETDEPSDEALEIINKYAKRYINSTEIKQ